MNARARTRGSDSRGPLEGVARAGLFFAGTLSFDCKIFGDRLSTTTGGRRENPSGSRNSMELMSVS